MAYTKPLAGLIQDTLLEALPNMTLQDRRIATSVLNRAIRDAGQVATSAEADFERMQWTFDIGKDCRVSGGGYLLIPMGPEVP